MSMEDHLFNLKFTSKQLVRESKRSEKNAQAAKTQCKKAMEKGNTEGARIYAENAIREKNQALNYLKLSSRIDGVAARVNTAVRMNNLSKSMAGVVKGMDVALKTMDPEKITAVMEKFEKQFEDLDVTSKVMEGAMNEATSQTMPQSQVEELMHQVADENNLQFESAMDGLGKGKGKVKEPEPVVKVKSPEEELEERLKKLQGI